MTDSNETSAATQSSNGSKDFGLERSAFRTLLICVLVALGLSYFELLEYQLLHRQYAALVIRSISLAGLFLVMLFFTRFRLRTGVILLAVFVSASSMASLFSVGLLSTDKSLLLFVPVILALAFRNIWPLASTVVMGLVVLIAGFGFTFGLIPMPDLSILSGKAGGVLYVVLDWATILLFAICFLIIISRLRSGLISEVYRIYEQNQLLRKEEETLVTSRLQLEERVRERNSELEDARFMLAEARERLEEQQRVLLARRDMLENTFIEIRAAQANLTQSRKLASLGSLSLGIAHEINNPLNFIQGTLRIMERRQEFGDDPAAAKLLSIIKDATGHINRIVRGLNQFGGKGDEESGPCDLRSIIGDCTLMVKPQLLEGVTLNVNDPSFPCIVTGKPGKLHQLFLNLLHNAAQATPVNGKIAVDFDAGTVPGQLIVRITDSGSGIPEDILQRITEPFFTTKPMGVGTGLGLYICQQIVNEHQGEMKFGSKPGQGTEVEIVLPLSG